MFEEADLIHRYSRAQAIADGVVIDASAMAKEAGFTAPMALTAAPRRRQAVRCRRSLALQGPVLLVGAGLHLEPKFGLVVVLRGQGLVLEGIPLAPRGVVV